MDASGFVIFIIVLFACCHPVVANDIGPGTRSDHCAFTRQNTYYVFGGSVVGSEPLPADHPSFSRFSSLTFPLASNTTQLPWKDLPSDRSFNIVNGACGITDSGYAIVVGYDSTSPNAHAPGLQIYNTNDQTWASSIQLNSTLNYTQVFGQRHGMASAMWAGSDYFVFGGSIQQNATQDMFALNTRTSPWSLTQLAKSDRTPAASNHSTMIATSKYIYHFDSTDTSSQDGSYQTTVSIFDPTQLDWTNMTRTISTLYPVSFVATNDSTILMIPKIGNYTRPKPQNHGPVSELLVENMAKRQQSSDQAAPDGGNSTPSDMLTINIDAYSNSSYHPMPVPGITLKSYTGGTITSVPGHDIVLYGGKAEQGTNNQLMVYDSISHSIAHAVSNVGPTEAPVSNTTAQDSGADHASGKLDRNLIGVCITLAVAGLTVLGLIALLVARRRQMRQSQEKKSATVESLDDIESLTPVSPDFRRFSPLKEYDDAVTWSDKVRNTLTGIGASAVSPESLRWQSQTSRSAKIVDGFYKRNENSSRDIVNAPLQVSAPILAAEGYTEKQIFSNLAPPPPSRFREHFDRCGSGISDTSVISADEVLLRTSSYHVGLETASNTQAPSPVCSMSEYQGPSILGSVPLTSCGGVVSDTTGRTMVPPSSRRSW